MMLSALVLAVAAAAGSQEMTLRPLDVFVFASPTGEPEKDRDLVRAANEVRKRIVSRKSWFRAAETEKDADIVVEVWEHTVQERLTMWASTGTMRGQVEGAARHSITKQHFLEARVRIEGLQLSMRGIDTTKNGSLKGAATALALGLEKECEKRLASPRSPGFDSLGRPGPFLMTESMTF
jgi:hypothetical protein